MNELSLLCLVRMEILCNLWLLGLYHWTLMCFWILLINVYLDVFWSLTLCNSARAALLSSMTSRSELEIRYRRTTVAHASATATPLPATTIPAWILTLKITLEEEEGCVITVHIIPQVTAFHVFFNSLFFSDLECDCIVMFLFVKQWKSEM